MRHTKERQTIGGRECVIHVEDKAKAVFIQPVDGHDLEELAHEISYIEENSVERFIHVAIPIQRWNAELTPWPAPPVFGKIPFGDGAPETLQYIKEEVLPKIRSGYKLSEAIPVAIGGYSLAGLFALWAAYQDSSLIATASASPSAWYKDWLSYAEEHQPKVQYAYLSLGDKEDKTKTKLMSTIKEDILYQEKILKKQGITCQMEWNKGNHFQDNGVRMAKGFVWILKQLSHP